MYNVHQKVFVAGHAGLVGSAIIRQLKRLGYCNLITKKRSELDLLDAVAVNNFFKSERPETVYLAAAIVGGIHGNSTYPVDFLLGNLKIQNNVIEAAWQTGVQKLLFLGSSCIYPKMAPQPIKEEHLLTSELEKTNEPYAIAKIAGIKLCNAINTQYGKDFISVMPSNLYGLNDNYHPENGHALPMLLRRFHEAKASGSSRVVIWGTGTPKREFLFADDLAEACVYLMNNYSSAETGELVNIGTGEECTILELAELISDVVGFTGSIEHDLSKPDGTPRKLMDVTRIHNLGWHHKTSLREGIEKTYHDFLTNPCLRRP
jgi:GDP-L-fucose synthase